MNETVRYSARESEIKWQTRWEKAGAYKTEENPSKSKCYVLEQFPYPSGKLHMGHIRLYTLGDVFARYKKAKGFAVLHPMGWDAFGLPAENAAIENKVHPKEWTYKNIENMKRQMNMLGLSYDWSRELATCAPEYYRFEQKMFLDFLKNGIAYRKESLVNWDPVDNTVLANEQVIEGRGWRSGAPVERKKLSQWFLKITDFADDLLSALKNLPEWPERVTSMQEKWIGKSIGATIKFKVVGRGEQEASQSHQPAELRHMEKLGNFSGGIKLKTIEVYTTRPDTIFGMSFLAISPQHAIAQEVAKTNDKLKEFIKECDALGTSEEAIEKAEKKGFDTGLKVLHPFNGKEYPVYVANFVLIEYGSGALFGCPAHDARDFEFAKKYNLPITQVVKPFNESEQEASGSHQPAERRPTENLGKFSGDSQNKTELPYSGDGRIINSEFINGLDVSEAKEYVCKKLKEQNAGEKKINFRLRDWGVSRQRYWGAPIPIIYCDSCGAVPVPEKDLPVKLPEDVSFDKPGNPLDHHPTWKHVACPTCSKPAKRETDTFDTFMESSWYFARYCSPNSEKAFDKNADSWLPVDYYLGGIEHAVLHLLYSRFFMRALEKCGYTKIKEPFKALITQGMVCRETYKDINEKWLFPEEVKKEGNKFVHAKTGEEVKVGRVEKMSKSKKNVVSPEEIIEKFGADTARLFMLSDSPPERDLEWTDTGIEGCSRYVNRLWKLAYDVAAEMDARLENRASPEPSLQREVRKLSGEQIENLSKLSHKTIKFVSEDLDKFHLNKAVARLREFTNELTKFPVAEIKQNYLAELKVAIRLIYPMLPHLAEEMWEMLGEKTMLAENSWPEHDETLVADETVTVAVQVNGKLKGTVDLKKDEEETVAKEMALAIIKTAVEGKEIRKIIYVKNKIINVVV